MKQETPKALTYIQTVLESVPLGGKFEFIPLERLSQVPVWINEAAHFTDVRLSSGYKFILVEPRTEMAADRLLALYRVTQAALPKPLILVTDQQRHQVRSALMRAHIGLVRTGNFLFAPQFGLHIKGEKLDKKATSDNGADQPFQPQEQVFLAAAILHKSLRKASSLTQFVTEFVRVHSGSDGLLISPAKMLGRVSRAMAHFQRRNLVTVQRSGVEVSISFSAPEVLWAALCRESQPLVTRTYLTYSASKKLGQFPVSGLSALSHYSDLLPPKLPTIAMSRTEWTSWAKQSKGRDQTEPTASVEVWKTNPRYLEQEGTVNPLLLALNCRRDTDERVRIAIREMLEGLHISADPLWAL